MEIRPKFEEVQKYISAGEYRRFPVSLEILSDFTTPIEVLRRLNQVDNHCFLLESAEAQETWGRFTFLGYDPITSISCRSGEMKAGSITLKTDDPGSYIRQLLAEYKAPRLSYLPSFSGGLVGYFSYDYLKYAEPSLHLDARDTEEFQDVDLMLFDKVIAFDNLKQKIILMVNMGTCRA